MKTLPDKPSELIRHALADLELAEKSNDYIIKMSYWHNAEYKGKCAVCLAGSVMAFSLDTCSTKDKTPEHWSGNIKQKLIAIDYFRQGNTYHGLEALNIDTNGIEDADISPYIESATRFKNDMRKLADTLEAKGL